ncbi:MAG TPA: M90 family metallopeptidase [Kofleriaceae bacterium]|nr:M90 family metallopeptidase [Kofleriaceae bacterium]
MFRARRRQRILAEPFPPAWDRIIDDNVRLARKLSLPLRQRLRELVQVFIAEKYWEGCGGLDLTEEMQVTIAAQACLLVLHHGDHLYDDVESILVYPSTMIAPPRKLGTFEQPRSPIAHGRHLIGEAVMGGPVVLAWDAVVANGRGELPGNVTLHEFAHKLDMANGRIDGTPPLANKQALARWARVCSQAFDQHSRAVAMGMPTLLDAYGATNEAEFFAVATESLFTTPYYLQWEHPKLYKLLVDFYVNDLSAS